MQNFFGSTVYARNPLLNCDHSLYSFFFLMLPIHKPHTNGLYIAVVVCSSRHECGVLHYFNNRDLLYYNAEIKCICHYKPFWHWWA